MTTKGRKKTNHMKTMNIYILRILAFMLLCQIEMNCPFTSIILLPSVVENYILRQKIQH